MSLLFRSVAIALATAGIFQLTDVQAQYMIIVEGKNGQLTKGVLDSISAEGVDVINFHDSIVHIVVPPPEIAKIRYRKDGRIKRHILWGAAIGAVSGLIIGAVTYEAHPCGFGFATCVERGVDPLTTTVLGTLAGGGVGALLGSRYKEIPIEGDPKKYEAAISFFENPDLEKDRGKKTNPKP